MIKLHQKVLFGGDGGRSRKKKVALEVFKSLTEKAISDTHLEVFLLDSGRSELRRAQCIDIKLDSNKPIPSPQKNATPAYYK